MDGAGESMGEETLAGGVSCGVGSVAGRTGQREDEERQFRRRPEGITTAGYRRLRGGRRDTVVVMREVRRRASSKVVDGEGGVAAVGAATAPVRRWEERIEGFGCCRCRERQMGLMVVLPGVEEEGLVAYKVEEKKRENGKRAAGEEDGLIDGRIGQTVGFSMEEDGGGGVFDQKQERDGRRMGVDRKQGGRWVR